MAMKNASKYKPAYYAAPKTPMRWAEKTHIEKAPTWCSVDLRDGNQSLIVPMNLDEKLDFFEFLVQMGFKEIEVGFPAASETEFEFLRTLIEQNRIPSDVTVQVLTQCREHIIRRTFDALKGAPNAIVHFYNSTSVAQREQVFKKTKEEIMQIAVDGAKLVKKLADEYEGNFRFEYSPESFTGTEVEYSLQVCNAVLDELSPTKEKPVIINVPATVSTSMPHVYANQVEYMCDNLKYRENVIVSLHPHNDRGTGVADAEMGLLAGAGRVEGTLFGNGERTGNVDLVTLGMNLYSQGIEPNIDFSNMPQIVEKYEKVTGMHVHDRSPYAGALVFAAFSGSHQDAIAKGMKFRQDNNLSHWTVPYLPIDPKDIGREYETSVIRINSQSGKGGIGYILEKHYGYDLPAKMREALGYAVKDVSDKMQKELSPLEIYGIFKSEFLNKRQPFSIPEAHYIQKDDEELRIYAMVTAVENDIQVEYTGKGNGRLDAVVNAIKDGTNRQFTVLSYQEHSLETGSKSKAVSYVGLEWADGKVTWGAGTDSDILVASVNALASAINSYEQ